ncbi:MAG: hypothetical protein ACRDGF_08235 [Chloroflexota bacterium]
MKSRGRAPNRGETKPGGRIPFSGAFVLPALLLLNGCAATSAPVASAPGPAASAVYAPKPGQTDVLRFVDSGSINPARLEGQPNQLVLLLLVGGQRKHDLTSPGLNINVDVPPRQVKEITVQLPAVTGSYAYWSAQPGDRAAGMQGVVIVR